MPSTSTGATCSRGSSLKRRPTPSGGSRTNGRAGGERRWGPRGRSPGRRGLPGGPGRPPSGRGGRGGPGPPAGREETAGEPGAAALGARRAAALEPLDEGSLRRLLSMLDRAGEPAAALEAFADFARRLEREYGVGPSSATLDQVKVIQGR